MKMNIGIANMTTYEIASLILGSVAAIILIVQLRILTLTLKADHERRKKQSTLDNAGNMIREARQTLQQEFQILKITEKDIDLLKNDKILFAKVTRAFSVFEHVSVGLNSGVYDTDLFFRMFGNTLEEIFDQYDLYMAFRREKHGKFIYNEFENLVFEYRKKQGLVVNNKGNIKHS